jgi:phage terminase large subunit GpA-like protein
VRWPENKPEDAFYACEHCEAELSDTDRVQMVMNGKWIAEHPKRRLRGYHLSGLNRVMGRKRQFDSYLHEFVVQFLDAKHSGREHLKVWTNTFLAETWEEQGERISLTTAMERAEDYKTNPLPAEVGVITCAVDVQVDRIEYEVMGWGISEESWGIQRGSIWGDPEKLEVWKELDDLLHQKWNHPCGSRLGIACTCVDSGFATKSVYNFTKPRQQRRVFAIKGSNQRGAPLITRKFLREGRTIIYLVGGDIAKDSIFARLKMEQVGPRYMHFPTGYGYNEEFFRQLTAEEVRTRMKNGFPIRYYKKLRNRNESLDLRVYNMAALEILQPDMERIMEGLKVEEPKGQGNAIKQPNTVKTNPKTKRTDGFANSWK